MNNKERNNIIEAAKISENSAVKEALDKLIFVVSLAHDAQFIKEANFESLRKQVSLLDAARYFNIDIDEFIARGGEPIAMSLRDGLTISLMA